MQVQKYIHHFQKDAFDDVTLVKVPNITKQPTRDDMSHKLSS